MGGSSVRVCECECAPSLILLHSGLFFLGGMPLACLLLPSATAAVSGMQEYKYRRGHQPCLDSGGGCSSSAFHGRVQYNAEEEGTMMLVCSSTYVAPFSQERHTHVRATLTFVSSSDGPKSSFLSFSSFLFFPLSHRSCIGL